MRKKKAAEKTTRDLPGPGKQYPGVHGRSDPETDSETRKGAAVNPTGPPGESWLTVYVVKA